MCAQASQTIYVTTTTDQADIHPAVGECDADPGPAQVCTLPASIKTANAMPGKQSINLQPTLYRLTHQGAGEDAGATGDLDVIGPFRFEWGAFDTVATRPGEPVAPVISPIRVRETFGDIDLKGIRVHASHNFKEVILVPHSAHDAADAGRVVKHQAHLLKERTSP